MRIEQNASLQHLNSFGVQAHSTFLVELDSAEDIQAFVHDRRFTDLPRLVVGGGSNLLLTRDFEGVVLRPALRGIEYLGLDRDAYYIRAQSGEPWHHLVQWTLGRGYPGLENLSLIPGLCGAAPIQNIGAYGVELKDRFAGLTAASPSTGESNYFDADDCEFGYRRSRFKDQPLGSCLILDITLRLPQIWQPRLDYPGLAERLKDLHPGAPSAIAIGAAVCALRRSKLPDPAAIGNAGSFFKNPIVSEQCLQDSRLVCQSSHRQDDGRFKLSAAALIEACGWKGYRDGDAGVSDRHALVLVNHGQATGAQLWGLAQRIQDSVEARFGLRLEPEPLII